MTTPEQLARAEIDRLLSAAGWHVTKTFKEKLFTEIFSGRVWVRNTLSVAKDLITTKEMPSYQAQFANKQDSAVI